MDPQGDADDTAPDPAVQEPSPSPLSSQQVAGFLRLHPDFLNDNPDLLTLLTPPSYRRGDNIVDMQRFMIDRLREETAKLKGQHKLLISTTRSNLMSQNRIHAAILALIGAHSLENLIHTVTSDLVVMLDIDAVTLCLEHAGGPASPTLSYPGLMLLEPGMVDQILGPKRDALLVDHTPGDPEIFGSAAGLVRSQALLRLSVTNRTPQGLLAFGSRRSAKFKPGQGTELLCFLARSLEITIAEWLAI